MQLNRILLYRADTSHCATRCRPALTFQDALPKGKANFQYSLTRQHSNVMRASKLLGIAKKRRAWAVSDEKWQNAYFATSRVLLSTTEVLFCIVSPVFSRSVSANFVCNNRCYIIVLLQDHDW